MKATGLICLILGLCLTSSLATLYTWNNMAGGNWQTASNWSPEGVPGVNDDAAFVYIDSMPTDQVDLTLGGDVTVNSLRVEYYSFVFKSGSLTVNNDCYVNGGWFYKINVTLNGNSSFDSAGSDTSGIACDGCVVNIKDTLRISSAQSGNTLLINNAIFVNHPGATFKIVYGGLKVSDQVGTLINYGTLVFETVLATASNSPWGDPPIAETGAWKSLENYAEIILQVNDSPIGVSLYNDIRTWNFNSGKVTLKMVQESTANAQGIFNTNYEFNDAISSGGQHDYYEANLNGDVHFVFAQAEVLPGQTERPFNPKAGDFFPAFANFNKFTGSIKTITFEGLASGLALGRKTIQDPSTERYHTGVVICASTDTACINSNAGTPSNPSTPGSNPSTPGSNPSTPGTQSTPGSNPNTPGSRTPGKLSSANFIQAGVMAVLAMFALLA